jgi:hypothetical protein
MFLLLFVFFCVTILSSFIPSTYCLELLFHRRNYLFFTPDIHDGTRIDLVSSLIFLNQSIFLSSRKPTLPGYYKPPVSISSQFNTTLTSPQLLMPQNSIMLPTLPYDIQDEEILKSNFKRIRDILYKQRVDCIVCMFYPGACQFFIAFNLTVLFLPAHRLPIKHCKAGFQSILNAITYGYPNVITMAAGKYDAEYLNYFSGLNVPIIESSSLFAYDDPCNYNPKYSEILVAPFKLKRIPYLNNLNNISYKFNLNITFTTIHQKLGRNWKFQQLYDFKAVIIFPYAVLSYYINDIIASGIPFFVPAPSFLVQLGCICDYRFGDPFYCKNASVPLKSNLTSHPYSPEDTSVVAKTYWMQFASFYKKSAIIFTSWDDLGNKLKTTNLSMVFYQRVMENKEIRDSNIVQWKRVFRKINKRILPTSYEDSLHYFNVSKFL